MRKARMHLTVRANQGCCCTRSSRRQYGVPYRVSWSFSLLLGHKSCGWMLCTLSSERGCVGRCPARHRCASQDQDESFISSRRTSLPCHVATTETGIDDAVFLVSVFLRCGPALKGKWEISRRAGPFNLSRSWLAGWLALTMLDSSCILVSGLSLTRCSFLFDLSVPSSIHASSGIYVLYLRTCSSAIHACNFFAFIASPSRSS